jgi:hypothetical protein
MIHDTNVYEELFDSMYQDVSKIFTATTNPTDLELGTKHIVSIVSGHTNEKTVQVMISVLEKLVSNNILTSR